MRNNTFKILCLSLILCSLFFIISNAAIWASPGDSSSLGALKSSVSRIVNEKKNKMDIGVSFIQIEKNAVFSINADKPFPLASVFKVPIMIAVMKKVDKGEFTLSGKIKIREEEKSIGNGVMNGKPSGSNVTFSECIEYMITISDNTATDLLWNHIGYNSVNQLLYENNLKNSCIYIPNRPGYLISLGLGSEFHGKKTKEILKIWNNKNYEEKLKSITQVVEDCRNLSMREFQQAEDASSLAQTGAGYYDDVAIAQALDNYASPDDMAVLLKKLYKYELLSKKSTDYCLNVMSRVKYNSRIPGDLPSGVKVCHKTGTICGIVNDMGIIEISKNNHVVLVVFIKNIRESYSGEATQAIRKISRMVYDFSKMNY